MKKIQLSVITLLGYSTLLMAGGDIQEITPFEIEEIQSIEREVQVIPPVKVHVVKEIIAKKALEVEESSVTCIYVTILTVEK